MNAVPKIAWAVSGNYMIRDYAAPLSTAYGTAYGLV